MSSHGHDHDEEVKGPANYDPKFGRGTLIGFGIFIIIFALALAYTDNWMKAQKADSPGANVHASEPAPKH